jgi:D-serine deaminase-like pyridoxal phosphate-dependent protein
LIHEDVLRQNAEALFATAAQGDKRLRIATKSIRIPEVIDLVASMSTYPPRLMCYSVREALFLIEWSKEKHGKNKFLDILIAYPTVDRNDVLSAYHANLDGHKIVLMIDSEFHVNAISSILRSITDRDPNIKLPVCVDVDCSFRLSNGLLHLGAHRSPCHTVEDFEKVYNHLSTDWSGLRLVGVMTYEAQIAGVGDSSIHNRTIFNWAIRAMKHFSNRQVRELRQDITRFLMTHNVQLEFFNGGGTGNIEQAAADPNLTEVTAGSGFLQPTLFDFYAENICSPAMTVALQITRYAKWHERTVTDNKELKHYIIPEIVCCQSGGFVSSGPPSSDKSPSVFLPRGLEPLPDEGFGEVQTPLRVVSAALQEPPLIPNVGDFILIRTAKSGEIAERFPKVLLINADTNASSPPKVVATYRGHGKAFF